MKKNLCYVILLISAFLVGCSQEKSNKPKTRGDEESRKLLAEIFLTPKENMIQLLAVKYKVPSEKIDTVMRGYLSSHDRSYIMIKQVSESDEFTQSTQSITVAETIESLEQELEIPSDILASIIIDYEIWNSAKDAK